MFSLSVSGHGVLHTARVIPIPSEMTRHIAMPLPWLPPIPSQQSHLPPVPQQPTPEILFSSPQSRPSFPGALTSFPHPVPNLRTLWNAAKLNGTCSPDLAAPSVVPSMGRSHRTTTPRSPFYWYKWAGTAKTSLLHPPALYFENPDITQFTVPKKDHRTVPVKRK